MRKSFNLNIYGDDALKAQFAEVKRYYQDKNPSVPLSDSNVGSQIIVHAYEKIEGKETNANRITTIVERQNDEIARLDALEAAFERVAEQTKRLEDAVLELVKMTKGLEAGK